MNNKPYVQEINDLQNKCAHYFAAANTYKGFFLTKYLIQKSLKEYIY